MELAAWIRDRLWRASNWSAELGQLRRDPTAGPRTGPPAQRLFDLASATEQCDPDRGRAMALYVEAWRAGHEGARARAKTLAIALSAHMTLAEVALAESDFVAAATAYLDAGFPDLAVEPLEKFAAAKPPGATTASETMRLEAVKALYALARRKNIDPEREIADALVRAKEANGSAAVASYLHAARIAKWAKLYDRLASILNTATRACPDDDALASFVEAGLYDAGNVDRVVEHYRARLDRAASPTQFSERARAAGMQLLARNIQPGLGLRLLRMSLERAYEEKLADVPSHIAVWELLSTHARAQRSTLDLVPLVVQAIATPVADDVAVYLARLGLEIAWRDASDTLAAQPYAAMLLDFAPEHPLAAEFSQKVSVRSFALTPQAGTPTVPAPAQAAKARVPVIDQGQVKRAAVPASTNQRAIPSRLALLKPPPPRPTSLERDTSPFPIAPTPATPPAERAPRKVVPIDVIVELPNATFFSTMLRDVSTSGAFIITKRALEVGTLVALEMQIPVPGTLEQKSFRTNARIVRRADNGWGLSFVDPAPALVAALVAAIE